MAPAGDWSGSAAVTSDGVIFFVGVGCAELKLMEKQVELLFNRLFLSLLIDCVLRGYLY
jgi:hypothetical protein